MSLLKFSYSHIHADQENFNHYLNELREHHAWEKVPVDNPYGSEDKMLVGELGKRVDEITAEPLVHDPKPSEPLKRKRGRPKGSKNKPKVSINDDAPTAPCDLDFVRAMEN